MSKDLLDPTGDIAHCVTSNVSVSAPFTDSSERPNFYKMRFPDEASSLPALVSRFEQHFNIIRGKHESLIGKSYLDNFSLELKIVDSFSDIAFNINFNLYMLNQLHDAITKHEDYRPSDNRAYYLNAIQEADEIAQACLSIMHQIKSWIPKTL